MSRPRTKIPTIDVGGRRVWGGPAVEAWREQGARCACFAEATEDHAVHGYHEGLPARWLGCPSCRGSAVGLPLVFRQQGDA